MNTPATSAAALIAESPFADASIERAPFDFNAVADALLANLANHRITLLPLSLRVSPEEIRGRFPSGPVFACDFHVDGIEQGRELPFGYERGGIYNIDHHAPTVAMRRPISSGNLAARYVREYGPVPPEIPVVGNHADCDSTISFLIIRGLIPPDPFFERAVIAADHTGAYNRVADLLQALDRARDVEFSARNLAYLLKGEPLEPRAEELLALRARERDESKRIKECGAYKQIGGLVFVEVDRQVSGEFFPALFPEATLILIARPSLKHGPGVWIDKLRLGLAAPDGFSLNEIDIAGLDPNFGGRWNAGGNSRGGGTRVPPGEYAKRLAAQLECALANFKRL